METFIRIGNFFQKKGFRFSTLIYKFKIESVLIQAKGKFCELACFLRKYKVRPRDQQFLRGDLDDARSIKNIITGGGLLWDRNIWRNLLKLKWWKQSG